jgi:hypothetical protein
MVQDPPLTYKILTNIPRFQWDFSPVSAAVLFLRYSSSSSSVSATVYSAGHSVAEVRVQREREGEREDGVSRVIRSY